MGDLDELLQSIRDEAKRENALALYEGTRQDDLVDEEIDERILRLLGLEDVFDIDYGTYLSLLKEKMIAARMTQQDLSTEESEILTNEFKRVKGKVGRFTIKKKKIKVDNIGESFTQIGQGKSQKLLPADIIKGDAGEAKTIEGEDTEKKDNFSKYLLEIIEIVKSIRSILENQNKLTKQIRDSERKRLEKEQRAAKEASLEKKKEASGFLKKLKGSLPQLSIFDKIKKFITNVLLGKAVLAILDWLADPKNKKKIDSIVKFLKDFAPAIIAAAFLFLTPFGAFIRGVVGLIVRFTALMIRKAIPALLKGLAKLGKFALKNPVAALGTAALGTAVVGGIVQSQTPSNDPERAKEGKTQLDDTLGFGGVSGDPMGALFAGGGPAMGTDTVPAMLTPGEFVMSKGAVDKIGVDNLMAMNAAGGGTNIPNPIEGIMYASTGGYVGKANRESNRGQSSASKSKPDKSKSSGGGGGSLKGLSGQDYRDLAYIVSGEAQRGTDDEYGVAAAVLNRVADPAWPNTIKAVGSQAGQFEAVYKGLAKDDPQLAEKLASPKGQAKIVKALQKLKGRTDFKGVSQYANMGKGDVKFSNRGNFYHYKEQVGKNDPPPSPIPSYYTKFIGSGGPKVDLAGTTSSGGGFVATSSGGGSSDSSGSGGSSSAAPSFQEQFMKALDLAMVDKKPSPLIPGAPESGGSGTVMLPPISQKSGAKPKMNNLGSREPDFPVLSPLGKLTRIKKLDTYGVVG